MWMEYVFFFSFNKKLDCKLSLEMFRVDSLLGANITFLHYKLILYASKNEIVSNCESKWLLKHTQEVASVYDKYFLIRSN